MERYEAYKDSGVEWIGEIPEGWEANRLKYMASNSVIPADSEAGRYLGLEQVQSWTMTIADEADEADTAGIFYDEACVLFGKLRPYLAKVALPNTSGPCSSEFLVLQPDSINRTYLAYALVNELFINEVNAMTYGVRMPRAGWDLVGNLQLPVPPSDEQRAIADYLDVKTAEIDALVADCEREVGLLQEYRKAVISEAVTKGLDPGAPMKDSGIEWIGNYPISWEYLKLGYTFDRLFDIDHWMPESTNEGYPYLMIGDLEELASRIDFESCKHISEEDYLGLSVKGTPKRGDVIIARYATIGTGCFVDTDEPFIVTYACLTVTPKHDAMRGRYLLYYTQSDAFERELYMLTNSNTQGNVGKDSLSKAHILLPPIDEQDEIVSALDASTGKIDELIQSKQSMADKLREYRRSFISEAVTGKFKVPGV